MGKVMIMDRFENYYKILKIEEGFRSKDIRATKNRGYSSGNNNTKRKRQPEQETENKAPRKDEDSVPLPLYDAAIVPKNIELLYLSKGSICELLKQPESFEEKVVGWLLCLHHFKSIRSAFTAFFPAHADQRR
ncbi:uncharacterized protein LOC127262233 [Andrographis paniculata]|uniref:uncharacterized protein LOC127262233 n=1 Tax=Andrographis paniculata TaxID=175694 RepID=UPI0021E8E4F0|nr:uncharacterized protein LOC127262233 [Andrographis paniculata]